MRLSQMRYFIETAKTGNISLAARNLFISQPALSQAIRSLEDELGIPLFIRHPKSVSLTDAGEQFLLHAQRITGAADQLSDLMKKHSLQLTGNLKIGVPWIAGYIDIFKLLKCFQTAMPGIQYKLTVESSDELIWQLERRTLHAVFAIRSQESFENRPDLYSHKIAQESYEAWVPLQNPLSEKEELTVDDLNGQNIVMPSKKSIFSRQLGTLLEKSGAMPHVVCETSLTDVVSQIAGEGLGIGFASSVIARRSCPASCRVVPLHDKIYRSVYYVTMKDLLDYPTIKSFTQFVEKYKL